MKRLRVVPEVKDYETVMEEMSGESKNRLMCYIETFKKQLKEVPSKQDIHELGDAFTEFHKCDVYPTGPEIITHLLSEVRDEFNTRIWVYVALHYIEIDDVAAIKEHLKNKPATLPKWAQDLLFPEE